MLNRHSPYNAPFSSMQFFWTYFPVAVLMVVEWIWVAYDLRVKVLVPWASMSRGFTPANQGWLLDYVGANYFLSVWTAIKYRHIVVLSIVLLGPRTNPALGSTLWSRTAYRPLVPRHTGLNLRESGIWILLRSTSRFSNLLE
ncbi:hypothetical protein DFH09DRAFT_1483570 [Mycena vulgaris]|nr:hypothetical protein DFH09DRAFT_1483570 [Mycena vulgaris]